jgi:alkane 1-monooxygenase
MMSAISIKKSKYLLVYITPVVVIFSLFQEEIWTFTALFVLFGLLPFLELFTDGSTKNLTEAEEEMAKEDAIYDWILYSLVPIQYATLALFLYKVSFEQLSTLSMVGMTIALGLSCGVLGINAAHELGHRQTWYEQWMSKALLLTTLYMHFFIEHNRGHHKNVSTDEDPASSKQGEIIYTFFVKSIVGSWISAWKLEKERLQKAKLPIISIHNEMLRFQIIQLLLVVAIYFVLGSTALFLFLGASLIGILLLESVNYIEHYGLRRKKIGDRYERTMPIHSWNSNHPIGRVVLLELSRHSDHHYMANRKYQVLRHFDESPQMPTGYPGMVLLALMPPAWFYVMDRKIQAYKQTLTGVNLE